MKPRFVGVGEVLWDVLPAGRQLGGAPANFAYHAAALGAESRVVSRVGRDRDGDALLQSLEKLGIDTAAVEIDSSFPTSTVTVSFGSDRQPRYTIHKSVAWDYLAADEAGCRAVAAANAVCFGTLAQRSLRARESIRLLLQQARRGALRILDVNLRQQYYSRELIERSLTLANVLKVNETELPLLAEMFRLAGDEPAQVAELARRFSLLAVAYTRGARGSLLHAGGVTSEHAGTPVRVADTVGAGDSFTAAFAHGLLAGWPLDVINERSAAVAAFVCSRAGATPELPAADSYRETWRPQFHFTPARNWMNDPNGLVFYQGEYHLFYQYNPEGIQWGHMSWGHAVSRDLTHWEHLPLALPEENGVMIFSGSAVVDWQNTSGFGRNGEPPLVAIYAGHYTRKPLQNQNLAYSNDRGRTWTKYPGNPVLDIGESDFRNPKVFWHEPTRRWVMAVAWPHPRKIRFYASPNLKEWTHLSDFGPAGATEGDWECPDLFPLAVKNQPGAQKWVLIVNLNPGGRVGGSACQYFVGEFDGKTFTPDAVTHQVANHPLWADWAWDFYAAVSWGDMPKTDGRRVWLGWMSNWQYAAEVPTIPWRSAMSIPRALTLRQTPEGWRLLQAPVKELATLRGLPVHLALADLGARADLAKLDEITAGPCELQLDLQPGADAVFDLKLLTGAAEETILRFDLPDHQLTLDRTRSGHTGFHAKFPGVTTAPLRLIGGRLKLRLFADTSSLEVFLNDGEVVLTSLVLPSPGQRKFGLEVRHGRLQQADVEAWALASAWPAAH